MGNSQAQVELPKLLSQDQFGQFILLCQRVVDLKPKIIKQNSSAFSGKQLILILKQAKVVSDGTDDQMCNWVQANLMNPQYPHQLIYPEAGSNDFQFKLCKDFMFIDDKFKQYQKNSKVMNVLQLENPPYFYTEAYQQNETLQQPSKLITNIRKEFMYLKAEASDDEGTFIDYSLLSQLPAWKEQYLPQIGMLPYVNLQSIFEDESERLALFINIYNLLIIHSIVAFAQKTGKFVMSSSERMEFYDNYFYNIGGHNYSLNDVEHGIMRCNDAYGKSKSKAFWLIMTGQTLSDKSEPRFTPYDPRIKMAQFLKKEPRIHFTLNCGAKSCPPIRVYEGHKLEQQLKMAATNFIINNISIDMQKSNKHKTVFVMSKIFSWYQGDFGSNQKEVIVYLRQFSQGELQEACDKIINDSKMEIDIKYSEYDWSVNNGKKVQQQQEQLQKQQ